MPGFASEASIPGIVAPILVLERTFAPSRMARNKRSYMAFKLSMENIILPTMYLWTVTTAKCVDVREVRKMWHIALHGRSGIVESFPRVNGLRAFELHPGGHGLHIHFVVNIRLPVDIVRVITTRAGFGRIHVKEIPGKAALYLGKYLRKADRPECLRGCRLWSAFGGADSVKVKDIIVESEFSEAYRFLAACVRNWSELTFEDRMSFVTAFVGGRTLQQSFESIGFRQTKNPLYAHQEIQRRNGMRDAIERYREYDRRAEEARTLPHPDPGAAEDNERFVREANEELRKRVDQEFAELNDWLNGITEV